MKCRACKSEMKTGRENYRYDESGLPNVTLAGIEVRRCPSCGAHQPIIPRIEDLHRALALAIIRKRARLAPAEVRFLRKYLGWSGADFARHMGVDPSTVSRWENADTTQPIGPTADRLLRLAIAHGRPVEEYPIDNLIDVATEEPNLPRVELRPVKGGWEEASAA